MPELVINSASLGVDEFAAAAADQTTKISLSDEVWSVVRNSRALVEKTAASGSLVYGLNTLLGSGRNTPIAESKILAFQIQLVRYHASGIGEFLDRQQSRALILARLAGFTRGGSGVRPETVDFYLQLLNRGVQPAIPRIGSVGSSDLTSLAAVASVAIGEGQAIDLAGKVIPGAQALADVGLEPLVLQPLEGLALVSANSYSTGVGALQLTRLRRLADFADAALALSLEAIGRLDGAANLSAFSDSVAQAKGSDGASASIANIQTLLSQSWLSDSKRETGVQDPLSFRSAPQTHGALRTQIQGLAAALQIELDSRSENPLVDLASGQLVSGGNFQVTELALAFEALRLGLAHVGHISERRIAKLFPAQRELRQARLAAADFAPEPDGFPGLLWYSAAALLSELKALAQPVTLLAPTLSADVEDHATLAPLALQQLERSIQITAELLAIEALTAIYLLKENSADDRNLGYGTAIWAKKLAEILAGTPTASELLRQTTELIWAESIWTELMWTAL